ncbi:MAG: hypothetical protein JW787_08190 [Sedimentisphaerales bacterium]|nr:hypothetical protein [Sedimentisphaerales bacterium]
MPALRRKQSNAMLYTLIIFVGLFIVSTTVAVFYYVKAEEHRTARNDLQTEFDNFVSADEKEDAGSIVGQADNASTYLGTMVQHLDKAISLISGGLPESTSAEVKINKVSAQAADMLQNSVQYIGEKDPNLTGLVQVIKELTQKLKDTLDSKVAAQKNLADLQMKFEEAEAANRDAYQVLLKAKDELMQDYNDVKSDYAALSELLEETTDEQVQSLKEQLDREKNNFKSLNDQFTETQAILSETKIMLEDAKKELAGFGVPQQDSLAYIPDGQILSIDNNTKIVYVNLGSNDRVYRGLTFAVYDKGAYIGQEGQDKAEIEIFDIGTTYSAARIIKSEINKPILNGDTIANLIWASKKTNEFVIAGDFDLNKDGKNDFDAEAKIKLIIEKWGGKVADKVSIETDFLIFGTQPQVVGKPTDEELEIDPTAMKQYETAVERLQQYNKLEERAKALWIPIFTYEKFVHLIGYTGKMGQAGAF